MELEISYLLIFLIEPLYFKKLVTLNAQVLQYFFLEEFVNSVCFFIFIKWVLYFLQEAAERERVLSDPEAILPAAFVSFKSRWGAAVCAQTQQSRNPTLWLTEWASEPSDVYWDNLAIPYVEHNIRKLLMALGLFFLIFFYTVPITFVQSLANLNGIEKVFPFLKHLIEQ